MTVLAPLPAPIAAPAPLPDAFLRMQPGRAHEVCGPARRTGAAWIMGGLARGAAVLWLRLRWQADRISAPGLADLADPCGLITLDAASEADVLACAEDALRSGACALVVADLASPPGLTPLRRLHLAAAEGLARAPASNLRALVLLPGDGGAPGVETRWHLAPCPPPADAPALLPAWQLERRRARMAPPAGWRVQGYGRNLRSQPVEICTQGAAAKFGVAT